MIEHSVLIFHGAFATYVYFYLRTLDFVINLYVDVDLDGLSVSHLNVIQRQGIFKECNLSCVFIYALYMFSVE